MAIYIGSHEVTTIYIGNTNPASAYIGSHQVYPDDYYFTLTFGSVSYSAGSYLYASGSNYCTATGTYQKISRSTGSVISSQTVTLSLSASYCKTVDNKLYFDYDTYKTTTVSSGSRSVTGSYNGYTCYGTISLQGNAATTSYYIGAISVATSSFPASGGETTISGGDVTKYVHWTSGVSNTTSMGQATFTGSEHSETSSYELEIEDSSVYVPSLYATVVSAGTYTITASYSGAADVTAEINQAANYITSHNCIYTFTHDGDEIDEIELDSETTEYDFSASAVYVRNYASGYTHRQNISASSLTASYENDEEEDVPITDITDNGTYWTLSIDPNTTASERTATVIMSYQGSNYGYLGLRQSSESYTFTRTTASPVSIQAYTSSLGITFTSLQGSTGLPLTSSYVTFSNNQIGAAWDSITDNGSGSYTVHFTCNENTSTTATKSVTITMRQPNSGNILTWIVNQAVAEYTFTMLTSNPLTISASATSFSISLRSMLNYDPVAMSASNCTITTNNIDASITNVVAGGLTGQYNYTFSCSANTSTTATRTFACTFTQPNSGNTLTFNATQSARAMQPADYLQFMTSPQGTYVYTIAIKNNHASYPITCTYTITFSDGTTDTGTVTKLAAGASRTVSGFNTQYKTPSSMVINSAYYDQTYTLTMDNPEDCIGCGTCNPILAICPSGISVLSDGTIDNADQCIDCQACFNNGLNGCCPAAVTFSVQES